MMHKPEEALHHYTECLKLSESAMFLPGITATSNNMGGLYMELGDFENALKAFTKCYLISTDSKDTSVQLTSAINLGEAYLSLKDYEKAQSYMLTALKLSREMSYKAKEQEVCKLLTKLYEETDQVKLALEYYKLYDELKSSIFDAHKANEIHQLQTQYEVDKKEKEAALERKKNAALKIAHDRADALLMNILPSEVAEELKEKGSAEPRLFENTTVLFTDFKNFTLVSEKLSPKQLVNELHECFTAFDGIISKYDIEKIKTVGDAYVAASGLPTPNPHHASEIIMAALEMRDFIVNRNKQFQHTGQPTFEMRIGINSGHVVAGIVGVKKFVYDIWGDTVNTAARMEQHGEPGKVNISETTYQLVKHKFSCNFRGQIEAKNKGKLNMYFVE
jgi:class 3 adenylate cyclase